MILYLIVSQKVNVRSARFRPFQLVNHRSDCRRMYERTSSKEQYVEITVAEEKRLRYLMGQDMSLDRSALTCEDGYNKVVRLCSNLRESGVIRLSDGWTSCGMS